jgi:LytS/YehU family sensor histidine kinase
MYMICSVQGYYQLNKTFNIVAGIRNHNFFQSATLIRLLGNPPLVCGLLFSLKSLKNWYLKKIESEALTRANTHAELQLLKSQIHPHFLFNTLNNIYSYALTNKPEAPGLVKKLKQTVHYMVAECNHAYVPLKNELNMIANYIELEKIRYGNRLSMQVELMNPEGNHLIAPLLMIPFVENSFKHGVSQMLDHPRINLKIYVDGNTLHFYLNNSKPPSVENQDMRKGIGLGNVRKRLDLLYPGKHTLLILTTEDSFTVQMDILMTDYLLNISHAI